MSVKHKWLELDDADVGSRMAPMEVLRFGLEGTSLKVSGRTDFEKMFMLAYLYNTTHGAISSPNPCTLNPIHSFNS